MDKHYCKCSSNPLQPNQHRQRPTIYPALSNMAPPYPTSPKSLPHDAPQRSEPPRLTLQAATCTPNIHDRPAYRGHLSLALGLSPCCNTTDPSGTVSSNMTLVATTGIG
ncbi:Hypothetical predicted protein [Pelobates cultripes]|uniref:Uncharacterized protein n=1 Tax=Pelobates cultripes TaxID=61616 RepID=A0AAD1TKM3_PELCU|nr:Hypothetical predicted protein [Pelobates cultripes]